MSCDPLTATLFIFVSFEYFVVPHEFSGLRGPDYEPRELSER